uniref:Uncharacterized protein n=1 Tax=Glossina austeni TaxID=7395 RepID=A0A1A9VDY5_GLOAU
MTNLLNERSDIAKLTLGRIQWNDLRRRNAKTRIVRKKYSKRNRTCSYPRAMASTLRAFAPECANALMKVFCLDCYKQFSLSLILLFSIELDRNHQVQHICVNLDPYDYQGYYANRAAIHLH